MPLGRPQIGRLAEAKRKFGMVWHIRRHIRGTFGHIRAHSGTFEIFVYGRRMPNPGKIGRTQRTRKGRWHIRRMHPDLLNL